MRLRAGRRGSAAAMVATMSEEKIGSPLGDHGAKVERDGWTGKRFAAIVFSGFVLVSVLNRERETALAQARLKTKAVRKLTN